MSVYTRVIHNVFTHVYSGPLACLLKPVRGGGDSLIRLMGCDPRRWRCETNTTLGLVALERWGEVSWQQDYFSILFPYFAIIIVGVGIYSCYSILIYSCLLWTLGMFAWNQCRGDSHIRVMGCSLEIFNGTIKVAGTPFCERGSRTFLPLRGPVLSNNSSWHVFFMVRTLK